MRCHYQVRDIISGSMLVTANVHFHLLFLYSVVVLVATVIQPLHTSTVDLSHQLLDSNPMAKTRPTTRFSTIDRNHHQDQVLNFFYRKAIFLHRSSQNREGKEIFFLNLIFIFSFSPIL